MRKQDIEVSEEAEKEEGGYTRCELPLELRLPKLGKLKHRAVRID